MKIVVIKSLVLEVVVVKKDDQDTAISLQVTGVVGIDDKLDWVDEVAEIADRVDIRRVINFL